MVWIAGFGHALLLSTADRVSQRHTNCPDLAGECLTQGQSPQQRTEVSLGSSSLQASTLNPRPHLCPTVALCLPCDTPRFETKKASDLCCTLQQVSGWMKDCMVLIVCLWTGEKRFPVRQQKRASTTIY